MVALGLQNQIHFIHSKISTNSQYKSHSHKTNEFVALKSEVLWTVYFLPDSFR